MNMPLQRNKNSLMPQQSLLLHNFGLKAEGHSNQRNNENARNQQSYTSTLLSHPASHTFTLSSIPDLETKTHFSIQLHKKASENILPTKNALQGLKRNAMRKQASQFSIQPSQSNSIQMHNRNQSEEQLIGIALKVKATLDSSQHLLQRKRAITILGEGAQSVDFDSANAKVKISLMNNRNGDKMKRKTLTNSIMVANYEIDLSENEESHVNLNYLGESKIMRKKSPACSSSSQARCTKSVISVGRSIKATMKSVLDSTDSNSTPFQKLPVGKCLSNIQQTLNSKYKTAVIECDNENEEEEISIKVPKDSLQPKFMKKEEALFSIAEEVTLSVL
jgi:hypothetical protein